MRTPDLAVDRSKPRRRASILLAVMVAIVLASLTAVTLVALADSQRAGASAALGREQLRALAWSGVRVALGRIEAQRDELLRAGRPDLPEVLLELDAGRNRLDVRLLPLDAGGALVQAENAKIDANHAPREVLMKLEALGEAGAERVLAARGGGAANLDELAAKAGLSHAAMYGEGSGSSKKDAGGVTEVAVQGGLADLLTVFSFDPAVQSGGGANNRTGVERVPFPGALSDRAKELLRTRLGDPAVAAIDKMVTGGKIPTSRAELYSNLTNAGVPLTSIEAAADLFTFSADPYEAGLVNINEAAAAVLRCLPGLDDATAECIINARATIDVASRARLTWVLANSAVTPEQYRAMIQSITTRSLQWRMRVEASVKPRQGESTSAEPAAPLRRLVLEVVIDAAGTRTRVASMKDVTYQDLALAAVAAAAKDDEPDAEPGPGEELSPDGAAVQGASSTDSRRDEPMPERESVVPPAEPQPPADPPPVGPPAPPRDPRVGRWRAG